MKKFFAIVMLVVATVFVANAQVITAVRYEGGQDWLYLEGGVRVPAAQYATGINWRVGMTIQGNLMRASAVAQERAARHAGYGYGYPVAGYGAYPMYGVYGGKSSSFSIQGKKAGFSTYSSEYGGYESSGTSVRVGEISLQMSNSGYSRQPSNYGCYGRSSSAVSQAQVKSDAKAAAKAYSMKNNGVANGSVRNTTSASPIKATREMNVKSFIPTGF